MDSPEPPAVLPRKSWLERPMDKLECTIRVAIYKFARFVLKSHPLITSAEHFLLDKRTGLE